jgi:hypothetical protein
MLSVYEEIKKMGFDLGKLRLLRDTINEIAAENNIPQNLALETFLSNMVEYCDTKLFHDCKMQGLKPQMDRTYNESKILENSSFSKDDAAKALGKLILSRFGEQDLHNLAKLLEPNPTISQSLLADVKESGTLTTRIGELKPQVKKLENEASSLEVKKLEAERTRLTEHTRLRDGQGIPLSSQWDSFRRQLVKNTFLGKSPGFVPQYSTDEGRRTAIKRSIGELPSVVKTGFFEALSDPWIITCEVCHATREIGFTPEGKQDLLTTGYVGVECINESCTDCPHPLVRDSVSSGHIIPVELNSLVRSYLENHNTPFTPSNLR